MSLDSSSHEFRAAEADWQEIDELVDDVARLADSDLPIGEFHAGLLQRAVRGLAAIGGAIWIQTGSGQIALTCQIHLDSMPLAENWADAQRHTHLLAAALSTGRSSVIAPHSAMAGHAQAANPTAYALILAPLPVDPGSSAVIEVFQRPGVSPAVERGYVRFLGTLSELAGDYQRNRLLRQLRDREIMWGRFERFAEQIHASLNVRTTCYTIANDGRSLIGCDRLSVGVFRGRKCRVLAASGVDQFDRRATSVQLMERLAGAVADIDEALWHDDGRAPGPPQIETPLEAVLDETHARALAVLPLREIKPREADADESPGKPIEPGRLLGVLIVEKFDNAAFDAPQRERIEAVARQSGIALNNAQSHENVPFMPLLTALGQVGWFARARQLPKTIAALVVAVGIVLALMFIQADFDVTAHGELQPEQRRELFARSDGIVVGDELKVSHGDVVKEGDLLGMLRKPQLDFESSRIQGELQTAEEKLNALQNSRLAGGRDNATSNDKAEQLAAEEREAKAQVTSLKNQQDVLAAQRADLELRSPLGGTVLTWNVKELLAARPVTRGQVLLAVADLSGKWVIEIKVPDDRIGHVLSAEEERKSAHRDEPVDDVSFIVATEPGTTHSGHVQRIALATESDKTSGATVLVTAAFDRSTIPADELRPGATVVAKIHCGRRSLGYVWLHELWETIQSKVLF